MEYISCELVVFRVFDILGSLFLFFPFFRMNCFLTFLSPVPFAAIYGRIRAKHFGDLLFTGYDFFFIF